LSIDSHPFRTDTKEDISYTTLIAYPQLTFKENKPMEKKLYPTDTVEHTQDILTAWNHFDPSL
jgi:hypothetical protein